jgi:hypothetical protein
VESWRGRIRGSEEGGGGYVLYTPHTYSSFHIAAECRSCEIRLEQVHYEFITTCSQSSGGTPVEPANSRGGAGGGGAKSYKPGHDKIIQYSLHYPILRWLHGTVV